MPDQPGRSCPVHYRYAPTVFATPTAATCKVLYVVGGVYIDARALHYDQVAWAQYFLAQWPVGSAAHTSYWTRFQQGPPYTVGEALPVATCARDGGAQN